MELLDELGALLNCGRNRTTWTTSTHTQQMGRVRSLEMWMYLLHGRADVNSRETGNTYNGRAVHGSAGHSDSETVFQTNIGTGVCLLESERAAMAAICFASSDKLKQECVFLCLQQ